MNEERIVKLLTQARTETKAPLGYFSLAAEMRFAELIIKELGGMCGETCAKAKLCATCAKDIQ